LRARSTLVCAGCGAGPRPGDPYGWACPNRRPGRQGADDIDHVMARRLDLSGLPLVTSDSENPFVRYRSLLHAYQQWRSAGRDDGSFAALVDELDDKVAAVEGHGFRRTPLVRHDALDAAVGARVWVKDETGNVSGSHKGRHLFGLMILIRVAERLDRARTAASLAIASCGNAALAAAVVAAAAGRRLEVFIPVDADASVVERLAALGATLTVCPRPVGATGDPCYQRFLAAVEAGAIPFGCQGPDNGLAVEGGATLAWETAEALAAAGVAPDRLTVQVGGGALASGCALGLGEAVALGVLARRPALDTVQTAGGYPLARAWAAVAERIREGGGGPAEALRHAAHHRSRYMWPWATTPVSVASGILDDETYDWLAVVRAMATTGGSVVVVDEAALAEANRLARTATGIDVDHTGSAGLAGLLMRPPVPDTDVVVVFSGVRRGAEVN
jgi:threonine synthase